MKFDFPLVFLVFILLTFLKKSDLKTSTTTSVKNVSPKFCTRDEFKFYDYFTYCCAAVIVYENEKDEDYAYEYIQGKLVDSNSNYAVAKFKI